MSHHTPPAAVLPQHANMNNMMDTSSSSDAIGSQQQQQSAEASASTVKLSKIISCEIKVTLYPLCDHRGLLRPTFQGTMNAFSVMGPNAATWKPVEGKHASIFGMEDAIGMSATDDTGSGSSMMLNADLAAAMNSIRNVTITKATLLQTYNTFGVPLGVTVNCLPRNEVVDTGDKYTFTTIPNSAVNTPFMIYEAGESHKQAMEWRTNYGKFTASNLTTQDVLEVPNCSYVFVHDNHPVVNLLRINKHIVGVDIDDQPRMDGQWLKITRNLFDSSCETIRNRILSRIHTQDLSNLSIQLHRIGGVDWSHVSTADALMTFTPDPTWDQHTLEANIKAHEQAFTEKPATFMARIQLEYEMQR